MNEQHTPGEAGLRMALRGLRRDITPARDLWPGIETRIHGMPRQSSPQRRQGWAWPLATAASLVLAVGVAWQLQPASPTGGQQVATRSGGPTLVQREAEGMTLQYRAALRELGPGAIPAGWRPGIDALDRGAAEIRGALEKNPDSRLLLEQLRATYTRRLALSRRALYA